MNLASLRSALAAFAVLAVVTGTANPASADSTRAAAWYLPFLNIAQVHQHSQGEGIVVAVVDTGVDATHPDLRGNVLPGATLREPDNRTKGQKDSFGHGTAIASLIAGHGHGPGNQHGVLGIAPKAKILPIDINTRLSGPSLGNSANIGIGVQWAIDNGADVICVALDGGSTKQEYGALRHAYAKGILVLGAAGNKPEDIFIGSPANVETTIAVMGLNQSGNHWENSVTGAQAGISAPAENIIAAAPGGGYITMSGTSLATAIATGVTALILAKFPSEGLPAIRNRLLRTGIDKGEPGKDQEYGWGVINPLAALTQPAPVPPTRAAPVTPSPSAEAAAGPEFTASWGELAAVVGAAVAIFSAVSVIGSRRKKAKARKAAAAAGPPDQPDDQPATAPAEQHWQRPESHPAPGE